MILSKIETFCRFSKFDRLIHSFWYAKLTN